MMEEVWIQKGCLSGERGEVRLEKSIRMKNLALGGGAGGGKPVRKNGDGESVGRVVNSADWEGGRGRS